MGSCCSVCGGSYSNRVYPEPIINTRENASGQEQKVDSIIVSKEKESGNIVLLNEVEKEKKDVSFYIEGKESQDDLSSIEETESEDIYSSIDETESEDDTLFKEGNESIFMTEDKRQYMKSIALEKGEMVYICGDIEGDYPRLLKVFEHIYGSKNIFQEGYTLLPFPPGVRIIFLGDFISGLKTIGNKRANENTQRILSFINANFDLFHHVQYSDGKIEDVLDEIKEKIFSSFIIPDAKIFVIEGNHDLEYFNVISDPYKYSEEIKSCPLLSNLKYSHLIKFISLLDQTTIQIISKTQEEPKYLFSHYPPYKQIPDKINRMMLFQRSYGLIPSTIDFKTHQIIHGHTQQHKVYYCDDLQFDPVSFDYSYQKNSKTFCVCLLDCSYEGITMQKVDLSIKHPPKIQSKKALRIHKKNEKRHHKSRKH